MKSLTGKYFIVGVRYEKTLEDGTNAKTTEQYVVDALSHKIGKSRFQRFDMVRWNGRECFIFGSTHGNVVLRDIDGIKVHEKQAVNAKTTKFLKRLRNNILVEEKAFEN